MSYPLRSGSDMPRDQYEYFAARSPPGKIVEANPQDFVHGGALSCAHEAKRTATGRRSSPVRSTASSAGLPQSANTRTDLFDKYKQYFASGHTPMSQSLNRSERSVSRMSDSGFLQPSATRSNAGADSVARPQQSRANQQSDPQMRQPEKNFISQLANRSVYAQLPQEPKKQDDAASMRSDVSSARASSASPAAVSAQRPASQFSKPQPAQQQRPKHDENPIVQPLPQPAGNYFGPGEERASTSARASEPQVISLQPYESATDRIADEEAAYPESENAPNPVTQPAHSVAYKTHTQSARGAAEASSQKSSSVAHRQHDEDEDDFSDRSEDNGYVVQNADQQPRAAQSSAHEPSRRPSYSRMSRSTASVETASSAPPRNDRGRADDARAQPADDDKSTDDGEVYTFKPSINARSRNLAARRPEYSQEPSEHLFTDADRLRKRAAPKKNTYQELEEQQNDSLERQEPHRNPSEEAARGVFSRLYTDAKRYNEQRAARERQIELQRMRDRGELSDEEIPEGSRPTAEPQHEGQGGDQENDNGESRAEGEARKKSPPKKHQVDFEVFDRLSKPNAVVKKYVQVLEEEARQKEEAAKQAEDARTSEMEKFAAYHWDVPAPAFKIADLQRQNALFVS